MRSSEQRLYHHLRNKVTPLQLTKVLGEEVAEALVSYYRFQADDSFEFNSAQTLVEALGNTAFTNKAFVDHLILDWLDAPEIEALLKNLNFADSSPTFSNKKKITTSSTRKLAENLIHTLDLDKKFFQTQKKEPKTLVSSEMVSPFNPIDSEDTKIEIPKAFLSLHSFQKRVKDTTTSMLLGEDQRLMIHMPTGSGKTKTCIESIIDILRTAQSSEGFIVWFAHSKELCEQAYETLRGMWMFRGDEPLPFYKVFGDTKLDMEILNKERAVLFIGFDKFNSILRSPKENELKFRTKVANRSRLVVVDEAHKSMAPTYKNAIDYCTRNFHNCKLIGLTATPGRTNENSEYNVFLSEYFGNNLVRIKDDQGVIQENPIPYLQKERVLANIDSEVLEFELSSPITHSGSSETLQDKDLKKVSNAAVIDPHRNSQLIDKIKICLEDPKKDSILIFAASTEHCTIIKMILQREGIESKVILGSTDKTERERAIADFKNQTLKILINFSVLTTGFDAPKMKTLIIARPIHSKILGSQIIGRALRGPKNGGNENNSIIVLKDNIIGFEPNFLFNYWVEFWGREI